MKLLPSGVQNGYITKTVVKDTSCELIRNYKFQTSSQAIDYNMASAPTAIYNVTDNGSLIQDSKIARKLLESEVPKYLIAVSSVDISQRLFWDIVALFEQKNYSYNAYESIFFFT